MSGGLDLEYVNLSTNALRWLRIAVVEPVFTSTAYSSYYDFYRMYESTPYNTTVTTNLNLLNVSIVNDWGISTFLINFLNSSIARASGVVLGKNLWNLTDIDVHEGALFYPNGTRRYDAVIVGFTEYVTSEEYRAYQRQVDSGGTLIIMDATNFLAEVKYYPGSAHASLYRGHNWYFNGTAAVKDVFDRWKNESTDWFASNAWQQMGQNYNGSIPSTANPIGRALQDKYGSLIFTHYHGAEENYLTNLTQTSIIATWQKIGPDTQHNVAAYMHRHGQGYVIHFGAFGSEIIAYDPTVQYFLLRSILYAAQVGLTMPRITFSVYPSNGSITLNGTNYNNTQSDFFALGNLTANASAPTGYRFSQWSTIGGLSVSSHSSWSTVLTITSSGTITAQFLIGSLSLPAPSIAIIAALVSFAMTACGRPTRCHKVRLTSQ